MRVSKTARDSEVIRIDLALQIAYTVPEKGTHLIGLEEQVLLLII